jgi:tetratricopeptide (TPR) repeat protein
MSVNDTAQTDNFAWNRQVYHRLKLALSLNLRRQLFLAVCDDLHLRNQVAARLHSTLAYPVGQVLYQPEDSRESSTPAYPRLATLRLNLSDPNPIEQINQWLTNYPPPILGASKDTPGRPLPVPAFQIVGVELLTRQPVAVQRLFLHHLRLTEEYLSSQQANGYLETSILLWVPRPWLSAIQQSAPEFWHSRTGVFFFAGDPTPTIQNPDYTERFAGSRSLDFDHFQPSILEEAITQGELEAAEESELNFEEEFDFPTDEPVKHQQPLEEVSLPTELLQVEVQQEQALVQTSENYLSQLPSLAHISQQLTELVLATINNKIIEDDEGISQAQKMLVEIERLHSQNISGEALASAYHRLGNFYRLRIEQGQVTVENLMVAIISYQEAISFDDTSPQLPDILNDLGTLYWMLYRTPASAEEGQAYIEQGIEFYKLALKLISPQTNPETYARVQNNLGTAYGDLARFANPPDCWQQAVVAYNEALHYRTVAMEPLKYAACQNNLGTAYWHLGQYNQPVVNLKKAIASYNLALAHYGPQDEPLKYGMIQNNIGTAYWNLAQYEQPAHNLRMAIDVYCDALKYRTPATVPSGCAATQNNLGTAYWHLANLSHITKEDRYNYLRLCIVAYDEALALAHSLHASALSFDLLATHNNLGLAHYQIATDQYFTGDKNQRSQHLEAALNNHLQALNGLSKQPEAYQTTFAYVVRTIRTFHSELGIQGQNFALSKVPAQMLPEILPKL